MSKNIENNTKKQHESISRIYLRTSLLIFFTTILFTLILGTLLVFLEFRYERETEIKRLKVISSLVAQNLAGELLINNLRVINSIKKDLIRSYELRNLIISEQPISCQAENGILQWFSSEACYSSGITNIYPSDKQYYMLISSSLEGGHQKVWWVNIMSTLLPLFLLGFLITLRIRAVLRESIVNPIISLANSPDKWQKKETNIAREVIEVHDLLMQYIRERDTQREEQEQTRLQSSLIKLSAQVAHDIRSPLAALEVMAADLGKIPEKKRHMLRSIAERIKDIANNLLVRYKSTDIALAVDKSMPYPELIFCLLDEIFSEKRTQYAHNDVNFNLCVEEGGYDVFAKVSASEFKRALSNLIDNSVNAIKTFPGEITVRIRPGIIIEITDNGIGISDDMLRKINDHGDDLETEKGFGLGLSYAINCIKLYGGSCHVESQIGQGTKFQIKLPQIEQTPWFLTKIVIQQAASVVIVDDDESIHLVWQERLASALESDNNLELLHFKTTDNFKEWYGKNSDKLCQIFIDYEFIGFKETGLDCIEQLGIAEKAILVTSHFTSIALRENCDRLKVKLIPKNYCSFVPIKLSKSDEKIVLIDDDKTLTQAWHLRAELAGKEVFTFNSINSFKLRLNEFNKETTIYIDANIHNKMDGIELAKFLHAQGFENLFIASGHAASYFKDYKWLPPVVDKMPPF